MTSAEFNLKTKQELLQDLRTFYQKEVVPILPEYEKQRDLQVLSFRIFISFITSIILVFIHPVFIIITIILFSLLCSKKFTARDSKFMTKFKENLMSKFLSLFGNCKYYSPNEYPTLLNRLINKQIRALKIFPNTNAITIDDAIAASYGDVKINVYEIRTGSYTGIWASVIFIAILLFFILVAMTFILSTILSSIFNIFAEKFLMVIGTLFLIFYIYLLICMCNALIKQGLKGVLVEYTFPKKIKSETFIYEDAYSSFDLVNKHCKNYEKVILEDSEFNKNYTAYSDDQVESRYLLTTAFIERFKEINVAFKSVFQRAEFKDDKLYILIKTKEDLFEFCDSKMVASLKSFNKSFEELYSIIKLIDHFKLDQKIGL